MTEKQDPYVPKVEEVKDRVREAVVKQKARDVSRQKAAEIAAKLKAAPDFEKAAKAAGFEAKTTELITRDTPIPGPRRRARGRRDRVQAAGRRGQRSDCDRQRHAVIKVLEKKEVTPRVDVDEGRVPRGAARPITATLLHRLYGQGEAEDEDSTSTGKCCSARV